MVNRHRTYWSSMSNSKYDFEPNKLDTDIQTNLKRLESKKEQINSLILELLENEPTRQEKTFSLIIDVLREWRKENE